MLHNTNCTASLLRHTTLSMEWSDPLQVRPKQRSAIGWPYCAIPQEVVARLPPVVLYILIGLVDFLLQVTLLGDEDKCHMTIWVAYGGTWARG